MSLQSLQLSLWKTSMNKFLQCVLSNQIYVATFPFFAFYVLHRISNAVFFSDIWEYVIEINLSVLKLS